MLHTESLRRGVALAVCLCAISCGDKDSPAADPVPIRGGERLAWDQAADSAQQIRSFTFRLYVDGIPATFTDTRCAQTATAARFPCSGGLPAMSQGRHVLEVSSLLNGVESPRSAPFVVMLTASAQSAILPSTAAVPTGEPEVNPGVVCTASFIECYDVGIIASDLDDVTALSSMADGRLLFVEGGRHVRVIVNDTLLPDPALTLPDPGSRIVGLAVDSQSPKLHSVFVAWTESARGGGLVMNITRYRELDNTLGEGATIVSGLPFGEKSLAPLAVDDDGLLYVALPAQAVELRDSQEQTLFGGAVLRFDRDGTTPATNPRASPIVANGYTQPTSLAIDIVHRRVWLGGTLDRGNSLSSFAVASLNIEPWPLRPVTVDAPGLENQGAWESPGPALAFARTEGAPVLLNWNAGLYRAGAAITGQLASLERLSFAEGKLRVIASSLDRAWYVAVRTDSGVMRILRLRPRAA